MNEECPHGDDPALCPPCQRVPAPSPVLSIPARFASTCPACERPIAAGDTIVKYDADEPWLCGHC